MRGVVKFNGRVAGWIDQTDSEHIFTYDEDYLSDPGTLAIAFTIPKTRQRHMSKNLHPFFQGMLAEGANKKIQCQTLGIDEKDDFTRLVKTAKYTIGAVTVEEE